MKMIELIVYLLFSAVVLALFILIAYIQCSTATFTSNVSMNGKLVIVTGANAGIGFHAAKGLAERGARVILACRNEERGIAARKAIASATGNQDVVYRHLDLASLKSVRQFAAQMLETESNLHVLINNAGVYGFPEHTEDGIVESMQVNYFGHFLLTLLLLPLLKKSQSGRVINLSSILHFLGSFNPITINSSEPRFLRLYRNYCDSKFLMLMFTVELSRRLEGTGVVANATHPGVIVTNITAHSHNIARILFWCWSLMYNRSAKDGAQTVEYLAASEDCAQISGKYFVDCASRMMLWTARSQPVAKQLWEYSERLVGYRQ